MAALPDLDRTCSCQVAELGPELQFRLNKALFYVEEDYKTTLLISHFIQRLYVAHLEGVYVHWP